MVDKNIKYCCNVFSNFIVYNNLHSLNIKRDIIIKNKNRREFLNLFLVRIINWIKLGVK